MKRWLREPLIHYLLIGAALFAVYHFIQPDQAGGAPARQIRFSLDELAQLALQFQSQWRREPNAEEFQRLVENKVQEEILWVCEAAHVPVIWATQVLETLAKTGLPSRAEVTDAAMGERAECVMLNKGPHVVEAVRVLDDILERMQAHQQKKTAMLRRLRVSRIGRAEVGG